MSPLVYLSLSHLPSAQQHDSLAMPLAFVRVHNGTTTPHIKDAPPAANSIQLHCCLTKDLSHFLSSNRQKDVAIDAVLLEFASLEAFLESPYLLEHDSSQYLQLEDNEKQGPDIKPSALARMETSIECDVLEQQLFDALVTCAQSSDYLAQVQCGLLNSFLLQVAHRNPRVIDTIKEATGTYLSESARFSEKVSFFLDMRLDKEISLPMLAQHLKLSISSVKRKLADEGLSFSQMLKQKRTYKGATILRAGRTNINAIASLCGFNSATQFTNAFKSVYGCTPKVFRKERRTP
ncbi:MULTISPECIES: AraC family transcriptional regulator [Vibrio]|uniref:AraC family transcriptional regulator n=1 Tax=Vibrio TaxID=662 RepID=UPI0021C305E4|nr:AraC family transcriptional regulator [Vibrio neonatus]